MKIFLRFLLRKSGIDAVSAAEAGMLEQEDRIHLSYAMAEQRVLVTFNVADFHRLSKERSHAGIILCPQAPIGAYSRIAEGIIDKLTLIDDWTDILVWVTV
jgi:hypothetical protein